jgi:hypothetical protein
VFIGPSWDVAERIDRCGEMAVIEWGSASPLLAQPRTAENRYCVAYVRRYPQQNGREAMRILPLASVAVIVTAGCATIMEGTSQSVQITTMPPGARCFVDREGARLGEVGSTPGSIRLDKSKSDVAVTCSKAGYETATVAQSPNFQGTTFGNILIGGGVGAIADAASGANYQFRLRLS